MITSPYDGYSRAPLRVGLAIVGAVDSVALAVHVHVSSQAARAHAVSPGGRLSHLADAAALVVVVAVAVGCFAIFARGRSVIAGGFGAVVALGVLSEGHASLIGGPMRAYYFTGALTLGWVFGAAFARGVATGSLRRRVDGEERLAEIGSVAVLAATYTGAAISKLLLGGAEWTDRNHLRAIIVSQHRVADDSLVGRYAAAIVDHGSISLGLGILTLVVQLGAVALVVSPTLRWMWSFGLLAFHLNVWLLTGILYLQALVLVALLGFPWGAIVRRARREEPTVPAASPRTGVGTLLAAIVAIAAVAAVGALAPIRRYASGHVQTQRLDDHSVSSAPRADVRALLGGLAPGDSIAGLRIRAIRDAGAVAIELERGAGTLTIFVAHRGTRADAAPRSSARYDLFYEESPTMTGDQERASLDAALDDVLARIVATEGHVAVPRGM